VLAQQRLELDVLVLTVERHGILEVASESLGAHEVPHHQHIRAERAVKRHLSLGLDPHAHPP
jgi:hypothetical protein